MFAVIGVLLIPLCWYGGIWFSNFFEGKRPQKIYAALFAPICGLAVFMTYAIARFYVAGSVLNDPALGVRTEMFGPFDPPLVVFCAIFAYGGATAAYKKKS